MTFAPLVPSCLEELLVVCWSNGRSGRPSDRRRRGSSSAEVALDDELAERPLRPAGGLNSRPEHIRQVVDAHPYPGRGPFAVRAGRDRRRGTAEAVMDGESVSRSTGRFGRGAGTDFPAGFKMQLVARMGTLWEWRSAAAGHLST